MLTILINILEVIGIVIAAFFLFMALVMLFMMYLIKHMVYTKETHEHK